MSFEDVITDVEENRLAEDSVWKAILDFNALTTTEKVKVLLSNGFRGVMVGDCSYGKRVFLGSDTSPRNKTRINHWDVVFRTKESQKIKEAVNSFVRRYCNNVSYQSQILNIDNPSNPLDYMLKYDYILCAQVDRGNNFDDAFFFFAMQNPWEDLDMISIHSYSANPLAAAYQVCPMANAVARKVSFTPRDSFHYVGHAARKAGLSFIDTNENPVFSMTFKKMEWEISKGFDLLPQTMLDKYNIESSKLLKAKDDKDLVEIAVSFLEDVFKYLIDNQKIS